jgi:hypothetical protein
MEMNLISILTALLGVSLFTVLLIGKYIGAPSYCFLIALCVLVGLVLRGFDRLQELDIRNLRMTLREIKKTKEEIFAKQEDLKKTALLMAQIMDLNNTTQGRWGSSEGNELRRNWNDKKLKEVIDSFNFSNAEIQEITKFSEKYKTLDELFEKQHALQPSDPTKGEIDIQINKLETEIDNLMRRDINTHQ